MIKYISNEAVSKVARVAGAPKDIGAGVFIHKHVGDRVKKGEVIFTIYTHNEINLKFAKDVFFKSDVIVI